MPTTPALSAAVADLVLEVASVPLAETLSDDLIPSLCAEAAQALDVAGAAVLLVREGGVQLVGWSDEAVADAVRRDTDRPDGLTATVLQQGVTVPGDGEAPDDDDDDVLALPLFHGDDVVGCLQVVLRAGDARGSAVVADARALARALGTLTGNAEGYARATRMVAHLSEVLAARAPVEQAKGVLAERHRVGLGAALGMLRASARRRRTSLARVAREVVDGDPVRVAVVSQAPETEPRPFPVSVARAGNEPVRPSPPRTPSSGVRVHEPTRRTGRTATVHHAS